MENTELTHWGIKGMRWGIRRWQNKDGSLTKAGRKKYMQEEHNIDPEIRKKQVLATRSAKTIHENAHLFSDEELKTAYNRLTLERDLAKLEPKGKTFAEKTHEFETNATTFIDDSSKLWNSAIKVLNATPWFRDNRLPLVETNDPKDGNLKTKLQEAQKSLNKMSEKLKDREEKLKEMSNRNQNGEQNQNNSDNSNNQNNRRNRNSSENTQEQSNNSQRNNTQTEQNNSRNNTRNNNSEPDERIDLSDFEIFEQGRWQNLRVSDIEEYASLQPVQNWLTVQELEDE